MNLKRLLYFKIDLKIVIILIKFYRIIQGLFKIIKMKLNMFQSFKKNLVLLIIPKLMSQKDKTKAKKIKIYFKIKQVNIKIII